MKILNLNLNFKQLFMLLFVSIIVCVGNSFYSKNLVADFDKSEFIEQDGIEDSVMLFTSENNSVFAGVKNRINYPHINSKSLKIECENCTIELLKPGELVLVTSFTNERTCNLIFKDSVKSIVLDKLQFNIKPLPPAVLFIGGVISGEDINKDNSFELKCSFPIHVLHNGEFKIVSFDLDANGKRISGNGDLKNCKECIDLINSVDKGQKISITCKILPPFFSNVIYYVGTWVKNY